MATLGADVEAGDAKPLSVAEGDTRPPFEVAFDGADDPLCPFNLTPWRKWLMVATLAVSCTCVTFTSSMTANTYPGLEAEFGIVEEVAILSISLFVMGLGIGPLFLGPLSEFIGRQKVLLYSFTIFFLFNLPVAFANHIALYHVFRFLTGFAGSSFLSVSGAAITDVFPNHKVGTPMMIFSGAPFLGPVIGPLVSGFIVQNQPDWHWVSYVQLIWAGVMTVALWVVVPEGYHPVVLARKAAALRKSTGDERYYAPIERTNRSFARAVATSCKTPFVLLATQPMVLFLDVWSAVVLGVMYLFFGGIPYVFRTQHGFDVQSTGMAFLGIGAGQVASSLTQPLFNRRYARKAAKLGGPPPPEDRLYAGKYGAVLCPLGVLLFGLTSFKSVHWIVPIIMTTLFGWGVGYSFSSVMTYLVDAYRPVAASVLASNSFVRSTFAAVFPLFGQQMYRRLGPVGGTCLLAGCLALCTPFPFIFARIGGRIRANSKFASPQ
ncbi:hypothetical protein Q8F55_001921 [Vanrija albida]|uniref:Major facilitator superfamily (MFS) profile domain-containing protein n=1 Tax=Vanrija albida TaxID=181172 RepID=A0ABR3Q8B3_9TREE